LALVKTSGFLRAKDLVIGPSELLSSRDETSSVPVRNPAERQGSRDRADDLEGCDRAKVGIRQMKRFARDNSLLTLLGLRDAK
jgi:hypothetical protein